MIYVIILLVLYVSSWGVVLAKHGEPKGEKYNIFTYTIMLALELWLLYKGCLFNVFLSNQ